MSDTKIQIGLSPEEVVSALKQMGEETNKLAKTMDTQLGQKASQSINDLKDNAERGTNQITKFFSNMGTRIREDLKTAFDATSVLAGAKFAKEIGAGVQGILDMDRAFDRLNVRMGLSTRQMEDFRRSAGRATAEAGVNIKDVQPGLMSAASRGGVRDPAQMTAIASALAQSRQINPELDTASVTDDVAEILKRQGMKMNGANFSQTMDAINAATVNGGFRNSNDAAAQIASIAPYAQKLGLDTRQMSGLASVASKSSDSGENILRQLLERGTDRMHGGDARINDLFGAKIFNNGKLDAKALAGVNTGRLGDLSEQVLSDVGGLTGANGADLKLFVETFKENMNNFDEVVNGANETSVQFKTATMNVGTQLDMFRERLKEAGSEIGHGLMEMVQGVVNQDPSNKGLSHLASAVWDNKGDLAAGAGMSIGASLLMGGGIRGLIGSKVADAEGIQKVYVTNAGEIAAGQAAGGALSTAGGLALKYGKNLLANAAILGGESLGAIGGMGMGALAGSAAMVAGAGAAGYGAGKYLVNPLIGNDGSAGAALYDMLNGGGQTTGGRGVMSPEEYRAMTSAAFLTALREHDAGRSKTLTNPSSVRGQGASVGNR
jgi:hypothetical protein